MTKVTLINSAHETHLERATGSQPSSWYGYVQAPR